MNDNLVSPPIFRLCPYCGEHFTVYKKDSPNSFNCPHCNSISMDDEVKRKRYYADANRRRINFWNKWYK